MAELPVDQLLSVLQAIKIIDGAPLSPRIERIALAQAAGRVLAADILADRDDPPFDKSLMDGFAVRAGDAVTLRIVGDIPAGQQSQRAIQPGEAISIMTGAPIPDGADAVVPIEQTSRDGDKVAVKVSTRSGQFISRRGSNCAANTIVLQRGASLGPAQLAVAASMGAQQIDVFARPRVAVLSTGDEIVPIDRSPSPAQIRDANSSMLSALLARLGCDVIDLGIVRDDPALIREKLELGMQSDVLFVSGGMSMGAYDYVPRLLSEMGVDLRISKLRIKPGKPFVFGVREVAHVHAGLLNPQKYVFGLPGNPVSGYVCTLRLASRLLARMQGTKPVDNFAQATLLKALPANGPREFYQPGILNQTGGIEPLNWKGSADIFTLAKANALIIREENAPAAAIGSHVTFVSMP